MFHPVKSADGLFSRHSKKIDVKAKEKIANLFSIYNVLYTHIDAFGHQFFYVELGRKIYEIHILLRELPFGGKRGNQQLRPLGLIRDSVWNIERNHRDMLKPDGLHGKLTEKNYMQAIYGFSAFAVEHMTDQFEIQKMNFKLTHPLDKKHKITFECSPQQWMIGGISRRHSSGFYETQWENTWFSIEEKYRMFGMPLLDDLEMKG